MSKRGYLFIESRDPWEWSDAKRLQELAIALARTEPVTVFFVQNGVLAARAGARDTGLDELREAGVELLADDFSLRERGIVGERVDGRVTPTALDVVVDHLAAGKKTLWH